MKFSIGAKLWTGFLSILLIFFLVGSISYHSTIQLTEAAQWRTHTYEVLNKLSILLSALQDAETGQRGYVITGEESYLEPYQAATHDTDKLQLQLKQLTADNPAQQQRLEKLAPLIAEKLSELQGTIDLRRNKGFAAAHDAIGTGKGKATMDDIRGVVRDMADDENDLLGKRDEEASNSSRNTVAIIVYGTLLVGILVVGAGYSLTRNISGPLKDVTRMAEQIAAGDLAVSMVTFNRTDEIGTLMQANSRMVKSLQEMAAIAQGIAAGDLTMQVRPQSEKDILGNAFATMVSNLRKLTLDIREGMNVLTASSSEILATTTQVVSGATETATAVSQTTTTVEEVKQTVQISSQKARQVSEETQKTADVSQSGRQAVEDMMEGMSRIREQTASTAESIVRLSEQSHAIGEIIASVNDLAEQSNVLAVNAAIEAAKVGEQGKGFAVVAQEIKSLAEQSKQATAQVRILLGDIQKATGAAVMATDMSGKVVETGSRQSREAGAAIRLLEASISESAQAAMQIAASSQQQLVGMDQVAQAMENIRLASTQNMAGTKQAEAAAQNLHELGIKLKQMVEKYKV